MYGDTKSTHTQNSLRKKKVQQEQCNEHKLNPLYTTATKAGQLNNVINYCNIPFINSNMIKVQYISIYCQCNVQTQ